MCTEGSARTEPHAYRPFLPTALAMRVFTVKLWVPEGEQIKRTLLAGGDGTDGGEGLTLKSLAGGGGGVSGFDFLPNPNM